MEGAVEIKGQEIARNWFALATDGKVESQDIFFQFIAIWIAFNALYAMKHGYERSEKAQIQGYACEYEARNKHRELVRQDIDYQRAVNFLQKRGGVEHFQDETLEQNNRRRAEIKDKNNLGQVLQCVYRIRNNLFHGGKALGDPGNDELLRAGYTIVSKIIADDDFLA